MAPEKTRFFRESEKLIHSAKHNIDLYHRVCFNPIPPKPPEPHKRCRFDTPYSRISSCFITIITPIKVAAGNQPWFHLLQCESSTSRPWHLWWTKSISEEFTRTPKGSLWKLRGVSVPTSYLLCTQFAYVHGFDHKVGVFQLHPSICTTVSLMFELNTWQIWMKHGLLFLPSPITCVMCFINHFIRYGFLLWSPNTATALGFPSCHRCDKKELLWWDYDLPNCNVHGGNSLCKLVYLITTHLFVPFCRCHHQPHLFAQRVAWGHRPKLATAKVNGWILQVPVTLNPDGWTLELIPETWLIFQAIFRFVFAFSKCCQRFFYLKKIWFASPSPEILLMRVSLL